MECRKIPEENNIFLANELWLKILSFLSIRELALVSEVCWPLNQIANDDLLWSNKIPQVTPKLVRQTQKSAKSLVKSYKTHEATYGHFFSLPGNNYFPVLITQSTFSVQIDTQLRNAKRHLGVRKDFIGVVIGKIEADKNKLERRVYSQHGFCGTNGYCLYTYDINNPKRRVFISSSTCMFIFSDDRHDILNQIKMTQNLVDTLPMVFVISNNLDIASTIAMSDYYPIAEVISLHEFENEYFWLNFTGKLMRLTKTPPDDYADMDPSGPFLNKKCNMM